MFQTLNSIVGTTLPIIQAPMANAQNETLAIAVAKAGALGSLPCSSLDNDCIAHQVHVFRAACQAPINLNFFCFDEVPREPKKETHWQIQLGEHYKYHKVSAPSAYRQPH